jgi:hypothetical protein
MQVCNAQLLKIINYYTNIRINKEVDEICHGVYSHYKKSSL